ncbi:hypothetical protein [Microbacterium sp. CPCC 204701]|uniref:hypothetical protein n=1 Tax=Microbacterium sp. CPCC 204701 TaxID=2493084 RepID=UPI000FD6FAB8|nr:hypothetical protein [Microbacterium sp. CPCC 204701]
MTVPTPPPDTAGASPGVSGRVGPVSAGAARDARLAWIIGGSLLVAHSAAILTFNDMPMPLPGGDLVLAAVWAGALLVLAFGIRRSGSVVARRPLGVTALVIAAVHPIVSMLVLILVPFDPSDPTAGIMMTHTLAVVQLAALAVAAVVIGRAGAVPHRLRWVPLIVLAVSAGAQIALQVVAVGIPNALLQPGMVGLFQGAALLGTLGLLVLGILSIVFAPREQAQPGDPVQIFPPTA